MRFFMYSRTQHKEQEKIADKVNRKFVIGRVYNNGTHKMYTEILTGSIPISRYSDAIVVSSIEDLNLANYTDATYESR